MLDSIVDVYISLLSRWHGADESENGRWCFPVGVEMDVPNTELFCFNDHQAVPFAEIIEVLALWFCISVPMVFLGAYFGYRKPLEAYPVATSNIPRQVKRSILTH